MSSSLTILKTPKVVSSRTELDQATPSLLILTATAGRGEVVDSNVTWKGKIKQLIIKTAVKYILHLFQQCEISEKELNIVDPVGAGPGKKNSCSPSNGICNSKMSSSYNDGETCELEPRCCRLTKERFQAVC